MVLIFAELESDLFWKWFSRPHQRDGMTVEDYYTQFGDWKHEMISLSFPANEDDYIDEFVANLSWNVRCRMYKYESRRRRLIDAYNDAWFEESMMIIEENLKQIKADKVFDNMPSRNHVILCNDGGGCTDDKSQLDSESMEQPQASGNEDLNTAITSEKLGNKMLDGTISAPNVLVNEEHQNEAHKVFTKMSEPGQTSPYSFSPLSLLAHEEADDSLPIKVDNQLVYNKLDGNIWLNKILMLIFDPGGCSRSHIHISYGSFKCCNEQEDCCRAVNVVELLIISDPLITCQEYCNERSEPNVQKVKAFILVAQMAGDVNGSTKGSTMTWFEKVTSIMKVALGKNVMEDNGHEMFDRRSKLRTHVDGIVLLVYDPGGSLSPHMDCDALKFDIRFQHQIDLHYTFGVLTDLPNFSTDYTINMGKFNSKVIEDKYSQVQNVFTKALESLSIGFLKVEINAGGNILTGISSEKYAQHDEGLMPNIKCVCLVEWGFIKSCKPLIYWTQGALDLDDVESVQMIFHIVFTMIQHGIVPRIVEVSTDYVIKAGVIPIQGHKGVRIAGHFFLVADKIELLASEAYNMVIVGNKLSKLNYLCVKSSVGKTFNQFTLFKSWRQVQSSDSIQSAQPLIEKLQQLNDQLLTCTYVNFQDTFSAKLERGIQSSTHAFKIEIMVQQHAILTLVHHSSDFSKIKVYLIGKESSVQRHMEGCGLTILHLDLGTLGSKRFEFGLPLNALNHFEWYLSFKGYDSVTIVKFHVFVWDPGEIVIFLYILEDNDVVERVGKDMVLMDTTLVIMGYDHEVQMRCLDMMDIVSCRYLQECMVSTFADCEHVMNDIVLQVEQCADGFDETSLSIANDKDRGFIYIYIFLRASKLLLTLTLSCKVGECASIIHPGVVMINPSFIAVVENFIWDPGLISVDFQFSTLRTRWLLRGRICHEMTFYYNFIFIFEFMYLAVVMSSYRSDVK